MRLNHKFTGSLVIIAVVLSGTFFIWPYITPNSATGPTTNFGVTVNPTNLDSPMYTSVGQNWTISYQAQWNQGDQVRQDIENATVTVQVNSTKQNKTFDLQVNTTSGSFSFDYSSLIADILTFNVTKLVTEEGTEYNANTFNPVTGQRGLESRVVTVWYDNFDVVLVESDTDKLGATTVSINVTYHLLPEEGLTLPTWATYSHQTFLPKIVHEKNVTINGIQARETATAGIYTAKSSSWLPTTYIHVTVAQKNWTTTYTGFSFAHNANTPIWSCSLAFMGTFVIVALLVRFVVLHKTNDSGFLKRQNFPFLAGILLTVSAGISLYWGIVGIESALHGFDWIILAALGLVSCGFGFAGALVSLKSKSQAFAISAVIVPLATNFVVVKAELDMYQLTIPWITLISAFTISLISGLLICNSEEPLPPATITLQPQKEAQV